MNNPDIQADLAKVAAEYSHSVLQTAILEDYKTSILLLRAKYASYEKIAEILNEHDIKVSVATIRKFCRKHHADMLRHRAEIVADTVTEEQSTPQTNAPADNTRPPLTSEPGKRGARPARDHF